jgi:hypothetical protein
VFWDYACYSEWPKVADAVIEAVMCSTGSCKVKAHESDVSKELCAFLATGLHIILSAYTAPVVPHQESQGWPMGARRESNAFLQGRTAHPTILAWHGSCGVTCDEIAVMSISDACTQHDPELHMTH